MGVTTCFHLDHLNPNLPCSGIELIELIELTGAPTGGLDRWNYLAHGGLPDAYLKLRVT